MRIPMVYSDFSISNFFCVKIGRKDELSYVIASNFSLNFNVKTLEIEKSEYVIQVLLKR